MSYLYASGFPLKNSCKLAQHAWEKSNDAYSLSMRVQTHTHKKTYFDFYVFYHNISIKEKLFSERELKKALRDTFTRATWLGPSNFRLVRFEHGYASYPGLSFRSPGFSPYKGREERRLQGLDYGQQCWILQEKKDRVLVL